MSATLAFGGGIYIADKSVWARTGRGRSFQAEWERALLANQIATCPVTLMEMLWSARSLAEFLAIETDLSSLRMIPIGMAEFDIAVETLRNLAAINSGYQRVPLADALIAAAAHRAGIGVLHYDHDFDRLREVLVFDNRWVAAAGSMP